MQLTTDQDHQLWFEDFESALDFLQTDDPHSKSVDYDGRRIVAMSELEDIEGGRGYWIVNYSKYRNLAAREDRAKQSTVGHWLKIQILWLIPGTTHGT